MTELLLTKRKPLLKGYEPLVFGIIRWGTLNESAYGNKKIFLISEPIPIEVKKRPYRKRGPLSEETKFKISQTLLAKRNEKNTKDILIKT